MSSSNNLDDIVPEIIYLVAYNGKLVSCIEEDNPHYNEVYNKIYNKKYKPNQIIKNPSIPFISDTRKWNTKEEIWSKNKLVGIESRIESHGNKNMVRGDIYNIDYLEESGIIIIEDASKDIVRNFLNLEETQERFKDFWISIPKYAENEEEHLKLISPYRLIITDNLKNKIKDGWKLYQVFEKPDLVKNEINYISSNIKNKYNAYLIYDKKIW